jgi:hypothetical protein
MDKTTKPSAAIDLHCRADFIFDSRARNKKSRPIKVLNECLCDVRRPDWDRRWNDWSSGQNPYLNLFLCEEHARKFRLME